MVNRFEPVLRRAEAALDVPRPARANILVELACDLESLYETYRARGLSEDEAVARAARALGLEGAAADELSRLHTPRFSRWTSILPARGRETIERALVTVLFLALALGGVAGLVRADVLSDASPFVLPVLGLGVAALALASALWFRLFITHRELDGSSALHVIGASALAAPVLGVIGAVLQLDALADRQIAGAGAIAGLAVPALRRSAQVVSLGLTVGLLSFVAWFHLRLRTDLLARAEGEIARSAGPERRT